MEDLFNDFDLIINNTRKSKLINRYIENEIDWNDRLITITGARGVGKTTLVLQHIIKNKMENEKVLYVSLDNLWFRGNTLRELAAQFVKYGGKFLFLDEVHKYSDWSVELKNIYDTHTDLNIVATASSALEIYKGNADLSRRAVNYELKGLSLREFLILDQKININTLTLPDILQNHKSLASEIKSKLLPLPAFKDYLKYGYYPYFTESRNSYWHKVAKSLNHALEVDLPAIEHIDYNSVEKLKKLLYVVAHSVPFTPNIAQISERIGATRVTTLKYLKYLEKASIILQLNSQKKGMKLLTKAEKIYLNNPNLIYSIAAKNANTGTLHETFFLSQLLVNHKINTTDKGDFVIDDEYIFEVGGSNKSYKQIKDLPQSYIAADEIETGFGNKIPLWLFGFLY